jgi:hypothetical protein
MSETIQMRVHSWVDQYRDDPELQNFIIDKLRDAVHFDCGDYESIPKAKAEQLISARPPFPLTLLQFSFPDKKYFSHLLVLWKEIDEFESVMMGAERRNDGVWVTMMPRSVSMNPDGKINYTSLRDEPENDLATQVFHGAALNLFAVLACSNVGMETHEPSAKLNKKRAKAGAYPIYSHKTLVVKLSRPAQEAVPGGGTHASPRVHLRRGHIRVIGEGRSVWVQSCVVGSKHGVVDKDYRIAA